MLRILVFGLMAAACTSPQSDDLVVQKFKAQLYEGAEMRATLTGSRLSVSVLNPSERPVCVWSNQWVDGNVHLIRVTEKGRDRPFLGEIPSQIGGGDRQIMITPGSSIAKTVDLKSYYDVRSWRDVKIEYSPVIESCEPVRRP